MADKTENVRIQLYINNEKAQAALREMDKEYNTLRASQKKFAAGSEDWRRLQTEIDKVTAKQIAFRKTMDLSSMSLRQLENYARQLKASFQNMVPGTAEFTAARDRIGEVDSRIRSVRSGLGPFQQAWKNLSGEVKGVAIAFAAMAGSQFFSWLQGIIKGAGDLDDQLADMRKTTGMTAEEVKVLNDELGKIDTRSSRKDLRDMAVVAGQMGFAGEEVLGFVKAVDMATVALGDEFTGGAEEVATVLGKLRNTLQDLKSSNVQMDLLHIGNAINELGAAGMATGPVVADFANRIGGYGIQAGLTSAQVLGLSATLQELGVTTERGGTAVVKIIQKMFSNVDQFSKIAGLSVSDFQQMLNTDLYGAFALVMQKSKEMGTNSVELNKIIQDLEVSGAGVSEVFAKLGSNTDMLTEKVTLAETAIGEISSITEEFNIKNATLGATLEKLKKDFNSLFTSGGVLEGIKYALFAFVKLVAVIKEVPNFLRDNKEAFKLLGLAILAFNAQLIASRAAALADIAVKKLQEIWILRAEYAQAMLNRTMNANPILRITALILGVVAAYKILTNKTTEAREAQEAYNAALLEGEKLKKSTQSITDRFAVINKLRKEDLQQLKNDIDNEVKAYKEKDAEMIAWVEKNGILVKLNELRAKEAESVGTYQRRYKQQADAEQAIVNAKIKMQFGYSATERNETLKRLRYQQESVFAQLGLYEQQKGVIKELSEAEKKAAEEALNRLENLREKIADIAHQQSLDRLSANDREIQIIRDKYTTLLAEAKKGSNEELRLTNLMNEEILAKMREQDAKELQLQEAKKAEKIAAEEQIRLALLSTGDKEIEDAKTRWKKLIELAEKYGIDTKEIIKAMHGEIAAIIAKNNANVVKKQKKLNEDQFADFQNDLQKQVAVFREAWGYISSMMDSFAQISENRAQAELQSVQDKAEKKKEILKQQLESGVISHEEYESKIATIDEEYRAKEKQIKREQFEKNKEAALIQASINTALSVLNAVATAPNWITAIVFGALAAAAGAAQIAAIESQPIPEFKKGGKNIPEGVKLVGEEGPELIYTPGGETILSNKDSANLLYRMMDSGTKVNRPQMNFDFAPSISRSNAMRSGISPAAVSKTSVTPQKSNYQSDKDKNTDNLLTTLISEVVSMKKVLEEKETGFSFSGRSGYDKRRQEYEEIQSLSGRK